jgi:cell division protein FtsQ
MSNPFPKRSPKTVGYRRNQWKGARAAQSRDRTQQARRSQLIARCRTLLRVVGGLAAATIVCWMAIFLVRQAGPVLQRGLEIREVTVQGMHQVTTQEVLERLALKKGMAQHQVSLAYLAERVRTHPWIKEAMVERLLLHALRVTIVERKPAAIARIGSQHMLTDDEGVVLTPLYAQDQPTLPLLLGVDGKLLAQGDLRLKERLQSAVSLAKWMAETLDGRIEIDVSQPMSVVASAKSVRFHFASDALKDQWERFMKVKAAFRMPAVDGRKHEGQDVDLRYDNRVIVRERG